MYWKINLTPIVNFDTQDFNDNISCEVKCPPNSNETAYRTKSLSQPGNLDEQQIFHNSQSDIIIPDFNDHPHPI